MKGKERQCNDATEMQKEAINGFVLVGIDDGFLHGKDSCDYVATKAGIFGYVKEGNNFYRLECLEVIWQR